MGTHTYVTLPVSKATFEEIEAKLKEAHYTHAFDTQGGELCIDMHGLALVEEKSDG